MPFDVTSRSELVELLVVDPYAVREQQEFAKWCAKALLLLCAFLSLGTDVFWSATRNVAVPDFPSEPVNASLSWNAQL
jgi:hypothetical protein